jgi:hypothetical protein
MFRIIYHIRPTFTLVTNQHEHFMAQLKTLPAPQNTSSTPELSQTVPQKRDE